MQINARELFEEKDLELQEWLESLEDILRHQGAARAREILQALQERLIGHGLQLDQAPLNTPYRNTIPLSKQPVYPGDLVMEQRIENLIRWNAMAMVLQAADSGAGVGGHIATYASAASMLEVGFNHFFRCRDEQYGGDLVNVQAHAAPGVYARAYLEGRLTEQQLSNFRRQLQRGGGLSSYPHPRQMPDFWQAPTASMGLSTPSAIYQARFAKYLEARGLKPENGGKVWNFIGDGEADEPEVLGTINLASRENLDNLVLVINCNLQRLDGPVRGNGKVIQELERSFRGADWQVIKVVWGSGWDTLLQNDRDGVLQRRMDETLDGDYQLYSTRPGGAQREQWVENSPELRALMSSLTDDEVRQIKRGGQDPKKIYAAFARAAESRGKPTVILVKTVKGDGLGESTQGKNTAHQKKQFSDEERISIGRKLGIPLGDQELASASFYRPPENSEELQYLLRRRGALGGGMPSRRVDCQRLPAPDRARFEEFFRGSGARPISTTMAVVKMMAKLIKDPQIGKYIVPIVPDEARTFGMEALFREAGIYAPEGQKYLPVDADSLLPYREAADGQILQEGICETGAMASFVAAGTAYANHGVPTIPLYIFYSMFGFQRVGDMIWAAADSMCRGFLIGGTAGRTTLNGEGLQHQDGHSHILASTVPNMRSYDPAFAFELAILLREGIEAMYGRGEEIFYYLTVYNENYPMPAMPEGDGERIEEGIRRGLYLFKAGEAVAAGQPVVQLFGSGSIMQEVLRAQELLAERGIRADVWSVTSYTELARDAERAEHQNRKEPGERCQSYLERVLSDIKGPVVACTDYMRALPASIARWVPAPYITLGTDGFGLSESRECLRRYFEVDAASIVHAAMTALCDEGELHADDVAAHRESLGLEGKFPRAMDGQFQ
ncbi:pyruvate dehydrogenase (acetyl-transferring), homodimeric type [Microbulbifer flavimaris]|uniref:Pyruvate dehydrogenase E1 component n=1 Tax=Microbulbifer flavimaris TaxID=1781068 RepID=A0ABX4I5F1_9GAMM|nr:MULTISPECIES: pyruvate dehydrogenase (acetyl-transferring), homodimeric type [Microbulbifer]KUJ84998.1 alpha-ketoglutarate dehydrogenase [Microbulbifer sp. ZGT114]PCO07090.1 pyruvate dehydrogenase (acetyl-transferring), homodimeric type [Microbulbifer flavimaris]